jgi:multicomponent Na+:H+ antiporter subunit D
VATGKKLVSELDGIGRRMPITMGAFFIGSLSIIGMPPCGGFLSKWNLLLGTLESGQPAFLIVLLSSSLLNAAYFMPIVYRAFFCPPKDAAFEPGFNEAPAMCVAPLALTAILSIALLFVPQPFLALAGMVSSSIFGG